jgi:hypothetical protein
VVDRTFLHPGGAPELGWAVVAPDGLLTPALEALLPASDVALDRPIPTVKYLHRRLADADLYFFFNEGKVNGRR